MGKTTYMLVVAAALLACAATAEERPWKVHETWPFDAAEANRRQQAAAEALGVPIRKVVTIGTDKKGKPVTMEFTLIPAGAFVMGTPRPEAPPLPDDERVFGHTLRLIGLALLVVIVVPVFTSAIRERRRPQISLARLLCLPAAASLVIFGGQRIAATERNLAAYARAEKDHRQQMELYLWAEQTGGTPAHRVVISRPFYIAVTELTAGQWTAIGKTRTTAMSGNPEEPMRVPNWLSCQDVTAALAKVTGAHFRLPTEAEWEYACRAGTAGAYYWQDVVRPLPWLMPNVPIPPQFNAWNLAGLHNEVQEWCSDWFDKSYYAHSPTRDPQGPEEGRLRIVRPDAFDFVFKRSSSRAGLAEDDPSFQAGVRVVMEIE